MLSGCQDDQVSMDVSVNGKQGGALTLSFLDTLEAKNYRMKYTELLHEVRIRVARDYESEQIPQLSFGNARLIGSKLVL